MAEDKNTHDVFEGDIPKDLGKKSPPAWLKIVGLVGLVGVLGTAAYMLESEPEYNVEPGLDITEALSERLPSQGTPDDEIVLEEQPAPALEDEIVIDPSQVASEPMQSSDPEMDLLEAESMDNAITIVPPAEPVVEEPVANPQFTDDALRQEVTLLTSRLDEIEASENERITVVKSGVELHAQSVEKLNALLNSLNSLKAELAALKTAPVNARPAATTNVQSRQTTTAKPSEAAKPDPKKEMDELKLLGVDTWGGERFAQIEYEGQIHLLATNEVIGDWRIDAIEKETVSVKNPKGERFELSI